MQKIKEAEEALARLAAEPAAEADDTDEAEELIVQGNLEYYSEVRAASHGDPRRSPA